MATETEVKQTNKAANKEQQQEQPLTAANIPIQPTVEERPANVVLKLHDTNRKGRVNIDGEDFVIDPITGQQRKARLLKGVNTIWVDEQDTKLKLDPKFVQRNKRSLEFENKVCTLQPHDKTAIQFSEVCNSNMDNDKRFGVKPIYFNTWNPAKEADKEAAATLRELEAMQLAATQDEDKMMRHAVYLGVSLSDELGNRALPKAIRTQYMLKAKKDPKKFLDSAENPAVDLSWAVKTLVANGTIDLGKQLGQAYWHDGGFITAIPDGYEAKDYLVQWALVDGEPNKNFKTQLLALVKK